MCVANVDCQVLFASEYFVTEIARRFNLLMDSPVVVTQSFFGHELFATHVADIITHHFTKFVVFRSLLADQLIETGLLIIA